MVFSEASPSDVGGWAASAGEKHQPSREQTPAKKLQTPTEQAKLSICFEFKKRGKTERFRWFRVLPISHRNSLRSQKRRLSTSTAQLLPYHRVLKNSSMTSGCARPQTTPWGLSEPPWGLSELPEMENRRRSTSRPATRTEMINTRRQELRRSLAGDRRDSGSSEHVRPWWGEEVDWWTLAEGYRENAMENMSRCESSTALQYVVLL